jgi:hypothetical protein
MELAVPDELRMAWEQAALQPPLPAARPVPAHVEAQYFVILTCRDEAQQVELLQRFQGEGLECRALLT